MILDEPTNGLDPQGISEMRNLIMHLSRDQGKTVLISSHLLYEIEQVASQMLIIHKGKKVIEGSVKQLLDPKETLFDVKLNTPPFVEDVIDNSHWEGLLVNKESDSFTIKMYPSQMPELNRWLVAKGANILEIRSRHSLEAYFLSLTNHGAN
jgi:ABC-type multidrug transport system ATPase subunit